MLENALVTVRARAICLPATADGRNRVRRRARLRKILLLRGLRRSKTRRPRRAIATAEGVTARRLRLPLLLTARLTRRGLTATLLLVSLSLENRSLHVLVRFLTRVMEKIVQTEGLVVRGQVVEVRPKRNVVLLHESHNGKTLQLGIPGRLVADLQQQEKVRQELPDRPETRTVRVALETERHDPPAKPGDQKTVHRAEIVQPILNNARCPGHLKPLGDRVVGPVRGALATTVHHALDLDGGLRRRQEVPVEALQTSPHGSNVDQRMRLPPGREVSDYFRHDDCRPERGLAHSATRYRPNDFGRVVRRQFMAQGKNILQI